jgi:predicted nucleotidyltransferase
MAQNVMVLPNELKQFYDGLSSLLDSEENTLRVYLVGSHRIAHPTGINSKLSDIDILLTVKYTSLRDYITCIDQAARLSDRLNHKNGIVDVFFLNEELSAHYFASLSVIFAHSTSMI